MRSLFKEDSAHARRDHWLDHQPVFGRRTVPGLQLLFVAVAFRGEHEPVALDRNVHQFERSKFSSQPAVERK